MSWSWTVLSNLSPMDWINLAGMIFGLSMLLSWMKREAAAIDKLLPRDLPKATVRKRSAP